MHIFSNTHTLPFLTFISESHQGCMRADVAFEQAIHDLVGRFMLVGLLVWASGWLIALTVSLTCRALARWGNTTAAQFALLPLYERVIIAKKVFFLGATIVPYWLFYMTDGCNTESGDDISPQHLGNCWPLNTFHTLLLACVQFTYFPVGWILWSRSAGRRDIGRGMKLAALLCLFSLGCTELFCRLDVLRVSLDALGDSQASYCQIFVPSAIAVAVAAVSGLVACWCSSLAREPKAVFMLSGLALVVNLELMLSAYWSVWLGPGKTYVLYGVIICIEMPAKYFIMQRDSLRWSSLGRMLHRDSDASSLGGFAELLMGADADEGNHLRLLHDAPS